jgi:hypothetical protein
LAKQAQTFKINIHNFDEDCIPRLTLLKEKFSEKFDTLWFIFDDQYQLEEYDTLKKYLEDPGEGKFLFGKTKFMLNIKKK